MQTLGFVQHDELPALLASADLFVFASSCENMPNTLVEAMAAGLPIACSDRGPMPEILQEAGVYFDPEDVPSIADAVARIVSDAELRTRIAQRARRLSEQYSWNGVRKRRGRCCMRSRNELGPRSQGVPVLHRRGPSHERYTQSRLRVASDP